MKTADTTDESLPAPSGLDFPVVGIGASAGGLAAIKTLLQGLPAAPDMAFVVVLHLSPQYESHAAAIFQGFTPMPVTQVTGPTRIERNHVYVIPPTHDLSMLDGSLTLVEPVRQAGKRVVVDLFFRTLADAHRERAVGIVLSGTGSDGATGIGRLKEMGGVVFAQAPAEAEFDDMPRNAIATGRVDIVLPAAAIAGRLMEFWQNARRIRIPDAGDVSPVIRPDPAPDRAEDALRSILKTLHQRTGHDFRNYKRATVLRRIERRLQVTGKPDLLAYRAYLVEQPSEARALLDDLLIGVTQFFRDRPAFEALERDILPRLLADGGDDHPVRAWVAGCSTGEEAYSIAMLLTDQARRVRPTRRVTVFATDIDERAIATARAGLYPDAITVDVPAERLRDAFHGEPTGWRIDKSLRDTVIFAVHNLLRDPPFSRLDLVSCRNLLIYLDRTAQQQVLEMFHFSLRPGGYLFLGSSETVDVAARLYTPVDKALRLYRANPVGRAVRPLQHVPTVRAEAAANAPALPATPARGPTPAEMHRQLVDAISAPSILVTGEYEIVHVSASAARYLRFVEGEPSHNLVQTIRPELQQGLRTALFQATQLKVRIDAPITRIGGERREMQVEISVRPVHHDAWPGEMLLVLFDEAEVDPSLPVADAAAKDPAVVQLEQELLRRNAQLAATIEQYETSSEELKASNEELQAINEELRSATEELETSKEELQSTNEELTTVNHELKTRIEETTEVNDDLTNLISSSGIATVFVDASMRIKRFTPAAATLFNIIAADVGRSLFDITHKLVYDDMAADARSAFATLRTIEREIRTVDGRHILARLLPYRTGEDRIGGAVMNFVDVTTLRAAEADVTIGREQMALIADSMTDFAIVSIAGDGRISGWSAGARQVFGYEPAEALGQPFDMLFTPEDRARGVPADELRLADEEGRAPDERWMLRRDGTPFFASGVLAALKSVGQQGYAKICRDRTDMATVQELADRQLASAREGAAEALHESELKSEFLAVMSHELKHPLNLINVNAELLLVLPEAQNLPAVLRAARTIRRTVQGQARIIDDLLDMSRTNTGKLTLNRVPLLLVEAIQPCMAWALAEARGKGVRLYAEGFDEPIVIDGDPVRIEQVAWNLLSNAVKFSRQGGSIVVRVSQDGNQALFEVKDSGRGIAPAFLPHIFEMFRQADAATTRGEGGLGIGLALVKSLVEMHGGRVAVESEGRGRGSTFKVWLPLHERTDFAPLGDGGLVVATRPLDGARVLLVDDTADTLETFGYLLEHEGAEVTPANSGVEAIEIAGRSPFDLIISDVGMPGMNGYEMMARLRADPATAKIPAIALTGYGRPEDVRQALDAGFQAHVDKPVDFGRMRSVIASVLSGASIAVKGADEPSRE